MSIYFLGIDPGQKGGLAVINDLGEALEAHRYPQDIPTAAAMLGFIHRRCPIMLAAIERVHAMPGQGVSSMFKFGQNYGAWQGALSALAIPYIVVTPHRWQKALLDAGTGETKSRSLNMARRRYPNMDLRYKADDGKADALHLAAWALREWRKQHPESAA